VPALPPASHNEQDLRQKYLKEKRKQLPPPVPATKKHISRPQIKGKGALSPFSLWHWLLFSTPFKTNKDNLQDTHKVLGKNKHSRG
jgi:hypothetical protein